MSQLKTERARLESDIKMKEELYHIHYSRFRESIRISSLISSIITRISLIVPLIIRTTRTFKNLYDFILTQIITKKQKDDSQEIGLEDDSNLS